MYALIITRNSFTIHLFFLRLCNDLVPSTICFLLLFVPPLGSQPGFWFAVALELPSGLSIGGSILRPCLLMGTLASAFKVRFPRKLFLEFIFFVACGLVSGDVQLSVAL
ncbi:hypothetical protein U1Q18_018273 [Sarracenia purpurea var. burkii]